MEYTSIQASCDAGLLVPWETPGKNSNTVMTYEEGCALYWSPLDEDGIPVPSAKILFTVMQGDTVMHCRLIPNAIIIKATPHNAIITQM